MYCVAFALEFVGTALQRQCIIEKLLSNLILGRFSAFNHASEKTRRIKLTLSDELQIEILLRQLVIRFNLVFGYTSDPS